MMWLAEASNGIPPETVGAIIGAVIIALVGGGVLGKRSGKTEGRAEGKAEAMLIGPQPFKVQLKEEFVTRREFEELKGEVKQTVTKMEGLFERTMDAVTNTSNAVQKRIENQNDRLSKKIEEVASGAYRSRAEIHKNVNAQGERLAKLEATSDVAEQLSKLAEAIAPAPVKIQPTHSNSTP
jgi:methyl-accepting chemotaxis protein